MVTVTMPMTIIPYDYNKITLICSTRSTVLDNLLSNIGFIFRNGKRGNERTVSGGNRVDETGWNAQKCFEHGWLLGKVSAYLLVVGIRAIWRSASMASREAQGKTLGQQCTLLALSQILKLRTARKNPCEWFC